MQYVVVDAGSIEQLTKEVNEKLKEGWVCQGGVAAGKLTHLYFYLQAMVKEDDGDMSCDLAHECDLRIKGC